MPEVDETIQLRLQKGFQLPSEKIVYFNGFALAMSPSDISIVVEHNNEPVAALNTSFTIAKTLVNALQGIIDDYETKTGQRILALEEATKSLSKGTE